MQRIQSNLESDKSPELPVSLDNARMLILRSLEVGRIQITEHFSQRAKERKFTTVEAERVLRHGKIVGSPRYCPVFENWCFAVVGNVESRTLEIRVGIDFNIDLEFPVMVFITGISKGGQWKSRKLRPSSQL